MENENITVMKANKNKAIVLIDKDKDIKNSCNSYKTTI